MKLQSKLFDTIRIKPRREEKPAPVEHVCDWEGCELAGEYRAPKGARSEGQYHHFCLEHVRHYNTAFNFFAGMDKDELEEALHAPPKAESRSSFATGNPNMRGARAAREALRPGDLKRAYKTLVKIHHPDANGGDKASEERLRTIIAAYSHLKKTGFVAK